MSESEGSLSRSQSRRKLRRWRLRVAAVTVPLLIFPLLEIFLQIFGIGPDVQLLVPVSPAVQGSSRFTHQINESLDSAYYGVLDLSGPEPRPLVIPKPDRTFRIAVVGGSTVIGFPYDSAIAFPRQLERQLEKQIPDKDIEVLNLGITAINSFAVADIVSQCGPLELDLLVVHTGHNEFYGPGGPASKASNLPSELIRLTFRCRRLRSVQLLSSLFLSNDAPAGDLMTVLPKQLEVGLDSEIYRQAKSNLRENLSLTVARAQKLSVPVMLTSVACNLRDQSPLYGDLGKHTTRVELAWKDMIEEASALIQADECEDALAILDQAAEIADDHAAVHYRRGQCYRQLGDHEKARQSFTLARDLDTCRFRIPSDFVKVIENVAHESQVPFVDIAAKFRDHGYSETPGLDLFHEHVHYNLQGHWLVGRILAEEIVRVYAEVPWNEDAVVTLKNAAHEMGVVPEDELAALSFAMRVHETGPFSRSLDRERHFMSLAEKAAEVYVALPVSRQNAFADLPPEKHAFNLVKNLFEANAMDEEFRAECRRCLSIRKPWQYGANP